DAFEPRRERLQRIGLLFGRARDAVFVAQQVHGFLVEDLPGEHTGLLQDLAAIFRIGVAVEIGAFVEKALALRVDDNPKRITVLLKAVADIEIAKRRRVDIPGAGMRARPMPVWRRAEIERHAEPLAGVEAAAAHLR